MRQQVETCLELHNNGEPVYFTINITNDYIIEVGLITNSRCSP